MPDGFTERRKSPRYTGRADSGGWRLFLPGEEVRCCAPHLRFPDERECGEFQMVAGPGTIVRVRVVYSRQFDERRRTPRGQVVCRRCHARLELEMYPEVQDERPAA